MLKARGMWRLLFLFTFYSSLASPGGIECKYAQALGGGVHLITGIRLATYPDQKTFSLVDFIRHGMEESDYQVRFRYLDCSFWNQDSYLATCHSSLEGATVVVKRTVETYIHGSMRGRVLSPHLETRELIAIEIEPTISITGKSVKRDRSVWEAEQCKAL